MTEKNKIEELEEFDYIVIGAGSSGAIIAKELSDNLYNTVLLVEKGEYEVSDNKILDTKNLKNILRSPSLYDAYNLQNINTIVNNTIITGRTVGGSSSQNYFIATRPSKEYHNKLGEKYGPSWNNVNAINIYKKLEDYTGKITDNRSIGGYIGIYKYPVSENELIKTLPNHLSQLTGAPIVLDYNDGSNIVISSSIQRFQHRDKTLSYTGIDFLGPSILKMLNRYLWVGIGNRNLILYTNIYVYKILLDDQSKAYGIICIFNGITKKFIAKKKVILCAGALNSPLILMRSGIGPKEILMSLGIPYKIHNSNIGRNLQVQYGPVMVLETLNKNVNSHNDIIPNIISLLNISDSKDLSTRNVEIIISTVIPNILNIDINIRNLLHLDTPLNNNQTLIYVLIRLLDPNSKGSIFISSIESNSQPNINYINYSNPEDLNLARNSVLLIKKAVDLLNQNSNSYILRYPPSSAFNNQDNKVLDKYIINGSSVSPYYFNTISIGNNDREGAIDSNMNLYGAHNLMVADCSILPSTDSDPGLFAMYIGKRAVQNLQNEIYHYY